MQKVIFGVCLIIVGTLLWRQSGGYKRVATAPQPQDRIPSASTGHKAWPSTDEQIQTDYKRYVTEDMHTTMNAWEKQFGDYGMMNHYIEVVHRFEKHYQRSIYDDVRDVDHMHSSVESSAISSHEKPITAD